MYRNREQPDIPEILKEHLFSDTKTVFFNKTINRRPVMVTIQFPDDMDINDIHVFTKDDLSELITKGVQSLNNSHTFILSHKE